MWWEFKKVNTHVDIHLFPVVNVQLFVRIDRHQQSTNIGLEKRNIFRKLNAYISWAKYSISSSHINEIIVKTFFEVVNESFLSGFIKKNKVLDPNTIPGSQGALHVQLNLRAAKLVKLALKWIIWTHEL